MSDELTRKLDALQDYCLCLVRVCGKCRGNPRDCDVECECGGDGSEMVGIPQLISVVRAAQENLRGITPHACCSVCPPCDLRRSLEALAAALPEPERKGA